jgi:DNA replicative helicase MCM subunit Mcm2 (Cdc46/Mcm family)
MSFHELQAHKIQIQVDGLIDNLKSREKFRELSTDSMRALKAWVAKKNVILDAPKIFGMHIKGLDTWKRVIALQAISQPQPFHSICIGDPASGKSEVAQSFQEVTPVCEYVWATKMSAAGLTLSRMGDDLAVGALPRTHCGQLFIDEFDKAPAQEAGALLGSMQHGWFGVEKASLKVPSVPAKVAISALANPKGDYWRSIHPRMIKQQLPFESQALLTRFHIILVVQRPDVKTFEAISRHQLNAGMRGLSHVDFSGDDLNMWKLFVGYLRTLRITHWENPVKIQDMITAFTKSAYQQDRKFQLAIPISPRLNDGIERIAIAYAKARLDDTVRIKDTVRALLLVADTLAPCGLDVESAFKEVKKKTKVDMSKVNGGD